MVFPLPFFKARRRFLFFRPLEVGMIVFARWWLFLVTLFPFPLLVHESGSLRSKHRFNPKRGAETGTALVAEI